MSIDIGPTLGRYPTDTRRHSADTLLTLGRYPTDTRRHSADTLPTLGRYSNDTWPIPYRHSADTLPTLGRYPTDTRPIPYRHSPTLGGYPTDTRLLPYRHSADILPTLSTDTLPTFNRLSALFFLYSNCSCLRCPLYLRVVPLMPLYHKTCTFTPSGQTKHSRKN